MGVLPDLGSFKYFHCKNHWQNVLMICTWISLMLYFHQHNAIIMIFSWYCYNGHCFPINYSCYLIPSLIIFIGDNYIFINARVPYVYVFTFGELCDKHIMSLSDNTHCLNQLFIIHVFISCFWTLGLFLTFLTSV